MAAEPWPRQVSIEEYFELEKQNPDICYEYLDGDVYMMSGGSFNHDTIKSNIQGILWNLLRGKHCRVYSSDMKTKVAETRYFHPDVVITCDPRDQGTGDLLKSPRAIFEVLSPSTELKDRIWKLQNYLALPTMEEYILVSSHTCKMEMYRKEQGKWVYYILGPTDEIELTCMGLHFPVAEAYERIVFTNEDRTEEERR